MSIYRPRATVNAVGTRDVHVSASTAFPWRLAEFTSETELGDVTITMAVDDAESTVFQGSVDNPGARIWETGQAKARGLPLWRQMVGPKSFEDAKLETILRWIADQCGARIDVATTGRHQRTYQLVRGPAYQLVQQALSAWRDQSVLTELDGGVLYVGPLEKCPLCALQTLVLQHGQNIRSLKRSGVNSFTVATTLTPSLRLHNRLKVEHPMVTGTVQITRLAHQHSKRTFTEMEVKLDP